MEEQNKTASPASSALTSGTVLSILQDVLRELWCALLIAAAVALIGNVVVRRTYHPEYTARTTFVVTSRTLNGNIITSLSAASQLAEQFSQVLESNVLKRSVAESIGLSSFEADLKANLIPETNLIALSVTSDTASGAFRIINAIIDNYGVVSDQALGSVILEILQSPSIPSAPSNSIDVGHITKQLFLAALAAAVLLIGFLSYMKDTVRGEQDLRHKVDARSLGVIYHERKWKTLKDFRVRRQIPMLVRNPLLSFRFVESNKMLASRVRSAMSRKDYKVLLVTSVTENEGKSTVAANLAMTLAQEKKRVLLIDCDFRKPSQYKLFEAATDSFVDLHEVLTGKQKFAGMIQRVPDTTLYTIFNATKDLHVFETQERDLLRAIIEQTRDLVDYVIIDTSPVGLVPDTEEIAALADATLLVVRNDMVWARDINDIIDKLDRTKAQVLGCVLNNAPIWVDRSSSYGYGYGYGHRYGYGYGGHYGGHYGRQAD